MDWNAINTGLQVVQVAGLALVGVYQWADRRHRATRAQIQAVRDDLDARLDDMAPRLARVEERTAHEPPCGDCEARLSRLEERTAHLPGATEIARLHERIDTLTGELREVIGTLNQLNSLIHVIHEHLLDKGRA